MSSEIRPEDIEAAIAAAEQRRRLRQGETQAAAGAPRRAAYERAAVTAALDREPPPVAAVPAGDDLDDSWLDQPARPRGGVGRLADLPDTEVVWEPEPGRRGVALPFAIAAIALLGFGGILWWAYGTGAQSTGNVPVIAAEEAPVKVKPAQEGGLEVPDQDKLVYNQITDTPDKPKVEQLLPQPEQPAAPLPAAPAAPTGAEPAPLAATGTSGTAAVPAAPSTAAAKPAKPGTNNGSGVTGNGVAGNGVTVAKTTSLAPAAPAASPPAPAAAKQVAKATAAAPAKQPASSGSWRIQLASVKSEAGARQEWAHMQKSHSELLADLRLTVQKADLGDKGLFFRIQAGPFPDRTTAEDVCSELKSAKQSCLVVKP